MSERCAACGKPITLVRASRHFPTLDKTWIHVSKRANRSHYAIPESARDAAVERAEQAENHIKTVEAERDALQGVSDHLQTVGEDLVQTRRRTVRAEADLAAARQQLDQVRDALLEGGQRPQDRARKALLVLAEAGLVYPYGEIADDLLDAAPADETGGAT